MIGMEVLCRNLSQARAGGARNEHGKTGRDYHLQGEGSRNFLLTC